MLAKIISFLMLNILIVAICFPTVLSAVVKDSTVVNKNSILHTDSLFQIIDEMHEQSASMESIIKKGYNFESIQNGLPALANSIESVKVVLKYGYRYLDINSLQTFGLLVDQIKELLDTWRKELLNYSKQISTAQADINKIKSLRLSSSDSVDYSFINLYTNKLNNLDSTFQKLKISNEKYQNKVSKLQTDVLGNYYKASDLQQELKEYITNYSIRTLGKEDSYIWESSIDKANDDMGAENFGRISLAINQQIITSYFLAHIGKHLIVACAIFLCFIFWVQKNYKKMSRLDEQNNSIIRNPEDFSVLSLFPVLPALIVVFSLLPLCDLNAPDTYMTVIQLLLFILASIFIFKYASKKERLVWICIFFVFIFFFIINTRIQIDLLIRIALLVINVFFVFVSRFFLTFKEGNLKIKGVTRLLIYGIIILNIAAFVMNCAGRVTFSKAISNAALIGFVQIIGLSIFKDIMVSAIQLSNMFNTLKERKRRFVDLHSMSDRLYKLLSFFTLLLCFIIFAINMNFYTVVYKTIIAFLFDPRTIGGTTFRIGNIMLFFVVIYLSTIAQRYVQYLFGERSDHSIPEGKRGSRIVIWKLMIIITGFILAVMVSGLPIDKVTIIISALGVGIGMGLQSVVNNFVSGLILIFERPLQVGDYIEVAGLKGWVKDIGIRSTRMANNDGSEIIVPNGSILAGNLTNWTLSSFRIRIEVNFKISPTSAILLAKEIIIEEILKYEYTIDAIPPEVHQVNISNNTTELKVGFWIDHINKQEVARSTILNAIYMRLDQNNITMN